MTATLVPLTLAEARRYVVCEAPAYATLHLDMEIHPVWSMVAEDQHTSMEHFGFCRDCASRLCDGQDLHGHWEQEFVPAGVGLPERLA